MLIRIKLVWTDTYFVTTEDPNNQWLIFRSFDIASASRRSEYKTSNSTPPPPPSCHSLPIARPIFPQISGELDCKFCLLRACQSARLQGCSATGRTSATGEQTAPPLAIVFSREDIASSSNVV